MKKVICLLICLCVIFPITIGIVSKANAEVDMSNKGTIFINNSELNTVDTVFISDNQMFIPLRTVLEALGSTVIWERSTGNAYFDFDGVVYVCTFNAFPQRANAILICKVININSVNNADYIQLHPMSADGTYRAINGRTYLNQQTGQRLFEALGCKVEIDLIKNRLSVSY